MRDKPLRIGFVLDDSLDTTDGVQQYVLGLGKWLERNGHEVHYLVGKTLRQDISNIHSLGRNITVRFNRNRLSIPLPVSRRRIAAVLKREKFDVLHVQMPYSPWFAAKVIGAADPQTAVLGTFHIVPYGWIERLGSRVLSFWLRRSLRRFDQVFCVSAAAQQFANNVFKTQAAILPNVVDSKLFHRVQSRVQGDASCTIVFLGRLVPRKGCRELLEALAILRHNKFTEDRWRVLIVGGGPLEKSLKQYAQRSGLKDVTQFMGFIDEADKPDTLRAADIAVFPSLGGESFGIVLIEAMAAGAGTVIGGDNLGYRSVLGDWPECLFDPTNTKEFADTLARFIVDVSLRKRIGKAQSRAVKQYDINRVGSQLLRNYQTVVAKRRRT